ncbi:MAG TPA: hypothetical protein VER12_15610 [Polyangiaceae bacterium]|nr:hypothetical protein [Polyangiaceae bacterium]
MVLPQSSMNRSTRARPESADPFAMQLALSRVHARLVPMQRDEQGYTVDPSAEGWLELAAERGFAGYGLGRALRMLLDVLRGLTALHDTFDAQGVDFAHGEVALTQFRVDSEGVCRLVPLTRRHSSPQSRPPEEALGHLAPERLLGEPVDARADVFSAGVLLWEALAGRRLFTETSADAIVERLMGEKLQMPQLPPELAWAIPLKSIAARALAVDPYQRFADCAELATAIAIVARERVATHAEIASFFGPQLRSLGSVAQKRPMPSRSSTFPSVSLPVAPASISSPPSSRNGFPLAMPVPRALTPAPRAVTQAPPSVTSVQRGLTPVPRSIHTASRTLTPVPRPLDTAPRTLTPVPRSLDTAPPSVRAPESQQRNAAYKSPFATLIGANEIVPASHRRNTLTAVGTPASALAAADEAPASAPRSSKLPLPVPLWANTLSGSPPPPSQAPASLSGVVARSTLESIPLSDVANFRSLPSRRSLIVIGLVVLGGIVAALIAASSDGSPDPNTSQSQSPVLSRAASHAAAAVAAPEPATTSENRAVSAPASREPSNGTPASAPKELRPASKAAASSKPISNMKDYGI